MLFSTKQWFTTPYLLNSTTWQEDTRRDRRRENTLRNTNTIMLKIPLEIGVSSALQNYTQTFHTKIYLIFRNENWDIERSCKSDKKTVTTLGILTRMEKSRNKNNCQKQTQASAVINRQCCLLHSLLNMCICASVHTQLCICHSTAQLSLCRIILLRHLPNQSVEAQCFICSYCLHRGRHDRCIWNNAKNHIVSGKDTNLSSQVNIASNCNAAAAHNHSLLYPAV